MYIYVSITYIILRCITLELSDEGDSCWNNYSTGIKINNCKPGLLCYRKPNSDKSGTCVKDVDKGVMDKNIRIIIKKLLL